MCLGCLWLEAQLHKPSDRHTSKDQGTKIAIFCQERLLSEHVMNFWVNFAKTVCYDSRQSWFSLIVNGTLLLSPVFWLPYDAGQCKHMVGTIKSTSFKHYQHFLLCPKMVTTNHNHVLDLEPRVDAHYRGHKLAVWKNLVSGVNTSTTAQSTSLFSS